MPLARRDGTIFSGKFRHFFKCLHHNHNSKKEVCCFLFWLIFSCNWMEKNDFCRTILGNYPTGWRLQLVSVNREGWKGSWSPNSKLLPRREALHSPRKMAIHLSLKTSSDGVFKLSKDRLFHCLITLTVGEFLFPMTTIQVLKRILSLL